jgi:hypothetical protein
MAQQSPPFRLEPVRQMAAASATAGAAQQADAPPMPLRAEAPRAAAPAAPAPSAQGAPPPADVLLHTGRAEGLSITLAAGSPQLRDRLAAASGELHADLARIGTEVEAIRVELRGALPSGLAPSQDGPGQPMGGQGGDQPGDLTGAAAQPQADLSGQGEQTAMHQGFGTTGSTPPDTVFRVDPLADPGAGSANAGAPHTDHGTASGGGLSGQPGASGGRAPWQGQRCEQPTAAPRQAIPSPEAPPRPAASRIDRYA